MTVIDIAQAKADRTPHMTGDARCLGCKHEWVAVAPVGSVIIECPSCSLIKGRFIGTVERNMPHWTCGCGNDLFSVTQDGVYCPNCGTWQEGL